MLLINKVLDGKHGTFLWYSRGNMDAITYLIKRNWISTKKVGGLLLAGTVISWVNFHASTAVPKLFPVFEASSALAMIWGLFAMVAGLAAGATLLGVLVYAPLYTIYRLTNTLHTWYRQRIVEEMLCSGLSGRFILARMVGFGVRWWLQTTGPSFLASLVLWKGFGLDAKGFLTLGVAYLTTGAVITFLALYATTWSGLSNGTVKAPLLASLLVVQGVPALGLMLFGVTAVTLLVASVYIIVTSRYAAIFALENSAGLRQWDARLRRQFQARFRSLSGSKKLSENPIEARETMRGQDSSDVIARLITFVGFLFAATSAILTHACWPFIFLVVPVVFLNSYRAAGKMSQIITEEIENVTLETIRSTPMTSETFLTGWATSVLKTQWRDFAILIAAIVPVVVYIGEGRNLLNPIVIVVIFTGAVLPAFGTFLGASIAGQGKPRDQISGQLLVAGGALTFLGVPQAMAATHSMNLPVGLLSTAITTASVCWLLNAGAKKSLNRVFQPQR